MGSERILIVEDDVGSLELIKFILQRAGYTLLCAGNGIEGIEVARREKPDLILMDLSMPELDGWSAAERIKQDPETKDITVVALSVLSMYNDKLRAQEAGFDGYLTKPIEVKTFVCQIAHFLNPSAPF